jgi:hypothetical protein
MSATGQEQTFRLASFMSAFDPKRSHEANFTGKSAIDRYD